MRADFIVMTSGRVSVLPPESVTLPAPRYGQTAYINGGGDSLSIGYPMYPSLGKVYCYQKYCADDLATTFSTTVTWDSLGMPGARTDQILAAYNDVIVQLANFTFVQGGINDVIQGLTTNTATNLITMIQMVVTGGGIPIYMPMWGANQVSDVNMATARSISQQVVTYCTANDILVYDAGPLINQDRPAGAAGNLNDLKPQYNMDDIHLNPGGYSTVGVGGSLFIQNSLS